MRSFLLAKFEPNFPPGLGTRPASWKRTLKYVTAFPCRRTSARQPTPTTVYPGTQPHRSPSPPTSGNSPSKFEILHPLGESPDTTTGAYNFIKSVPTQPSHDWSSSASGTRSRGLKYSICSISRRTSLCCRTPDVTGRPLSHQLRQLFTHSQQVALSTLAT